MSHVLEILCSDCWFKSFSLEKKTIKNIRIKKNGLENSSLKWLGAHFLDFIWTFFWFLHFFMLSFIIRWLLVVGRHWHQILSPFLCHFILDFCDGIRSDRMSMLTHYKNVDNFFDLLFINRRKRADGLPVNEFHFSFF